MFLNLPTLYRPCPVMYERAAASKYYARKGPPDLADLPESLPHSYKEILRGKKSITKYIHISDTESVINQFKQPSVKFRIQ